MASDIESEHLESFMQQFERAAAMVCSLLSVAELDRSVIEPSSAELDWFRNANREKFDQLLQHVSDQVVANLRNQIAGYRRMPASELYQESLQIQAKIDSKNDEILRRDPEDVEIMRGDLYLLRKLLRDGIDFYERELSAPSLALRHAEYCDVAMKQLPDEYISKIPDTKGPGKRITKKQMVAIQDTEFRNHAFRQHYLRSHVAAVTYVKGAVEVLVDQAEITSPDETGNLFDRSTIQMGKTDGSCSVQ